MKKEYQIYGIRAILEAIASERPINKIFLQKGLKGELFQELETAIRKNGISQSYVPVEKLNRLTRSNHQGAVAQISPVSFHNFEELVEQIIQKEEKTVFYCCWTKYRMSETLVPLLGLPNAPGFMG